MRTLLRLSIVILGQMAGAAAAPEAPEADRKKVEFFEALYTVDIEGVRPLDEYDDPDAFYAAIARQVGIPDRAFEAVQTKYGWKQDDDFFLSAMVKGGWDGDYWGVMVTKIPVNLKAAETMEEKMAAMERMEMKMVVIGYDGSVSFPGDPLVREFGSTQSPDGSKRLEVVRRDRDIVDFEVFDAVDGEKLAGDSIGWSAMRWFLAWETSSRLWGYGSDIGYFKVFEFGEEGAVEETTVDETMAIPSIVWDHLPRSLQSEYPVAPRE